MGRLAIRKIVVHDTCDKGILKILEPGEYVFTESRYDNFFLDNVTLCSVVGKNGCGKSSLIELLFRMINNLGAMVLRRFDRPAAEELFFIGDVVADLHYSMDGEEGCLRCEKDAVTLTHGAHYFKWRGYDGKCVHKVAENVRLLVADGLSGAACCGGELGQEAERFL